MILCPAPITLDITMHLYHSPYLLNRHHHLFPHFYLMDDFENELLRFPFVRLFDGLYLP
jgi:hypothetical protein